MLPCLNLNTDTQKQVQRTAARTTLHSGSSLPERRLQWLPQGYRSPNGLEMIRDDPRMQIRRSEMGTGVG